MTTSDIFTVVASVLASVGGVGVVLLGLSHWLGKAWLARFQEAEKAGHDRTLELIRTSLTVQGSRLQRNADARFSLYTDLWERLQHLKVAGDVLWQSASVENLDRFVDAFVEAKYAIEVGRLILSHELYERLTATLRRLEDYRFGKERLLELRSAPRLAGRCEAMDDAAHQIARNHSYKREFEDLLEEVLSIFHTETGSC